MTVKLWTTESLTPGNISHLNILREVECLRGPAEVGRDGGLQLPGRPVLEAAGGWGGQLEDPPDLLSLGLHCAGHGAEGKLKKKCLRVSTELRLGEVSPQWRRTGVCSSGRRDCWAPPVCPGSPGSPVWSERRALRISWPERPASCRSLTGSLQACRPPHQPQISSSSSSRPPAAPSSGPPCLSELSTSVSPSSARWWASLRQPAGKQSQTEGLTDRLSVFTFLSHHTLSPSLSPSLSLSYLKAGYLRVLSLLGVDLQYSLVDGLPLSVLTLAAHGRLSGTWQQQHLNF